MDDTSVNKLLEKAFDDEAQGSRDDIMQETPINSNPGSAPHPDRANNSSHRTSTQESRPKYSVPKADRNQLPQDLFENKPEVANALIMKLKSLDFNFAGTIMFEPCTGNGAISKIFEAEGCQVICRDLHTLPNKHDFLTEELPEDFGIIVTNPPYCLKYQFLSKCIKIGKPFALLLPLDMIATKKWAKITKGHYFYFIILNPVPKFIHDGKEVSIGPTFWVFGNIGLPSSLLENFELITTEEFREEEKD